MLTACIPLVLDAARSDIVKHGRASQEPIAVSRYLVSVQTAQIISEISRRYDTSDE